MPIPAKKTMKKNLSLLILLFVTALLPLACSYPYAPYGPVSVTHPHPPSTPVANPTYAVSTPPYKTSWGTAGGPNALAFGMGTTLFVAEGDGTVAMVEVFDSSSPSAPLSQWTSYGSQPFSWPGGVATSPVNHNVYVADNLNNAIYEFTSAGVTVNAWTGYGGLPFNGPEGIGADPSGNIYLADTGNNKVEEFDSNGNPLHQWNGGGGLNFFQPSAVSLDASGNVYVADAGNERVLEFSPGGVTLINSWPTVHYADVFGIAVDGTGNIYAADFGDGTPYNGNGLMEEYNPTGQTMAVWGSSAGTQAFGPDGVALSGADIFVADWNNDLIQVFGP